MTKEASTFSATLQRAEKELKGLVAAAEVRSASGLGPGRKPSVHSSFWLLAARSTCSHTRCAHCTIAGGAGGRQGGARVGAAACV